MDWFTMNAYYLIPCWAFLLDCVLGDPRSKYHPVVLIGDVISFYEKLLYHPTDSDRVKYWYGTCTVLLTIVTVLFVAVALLALAGTIHFWVAYLVQVLIVYITISPRSLSEAGMELYRLLREGNLPQARYKVGWIVGRDTTELDEGEITRATVETIAENTTDGIIAPLVFFALAGPLGSLLYRTINTMDSMLGYKNDKYLFFGRFAARLDDAANYIPARLTCVLFILSALLLGKDSKEAWRITRRDASKHPSPNGGYAESPVAGALHIRLGGYNTYHGRVTFREYMGNPDVPLAGIHIKQTIQMMYTCTILGLVCTTFLAYMLVKL